MSYSDDKFTGNIGDIRAVEDTIRATKKYTEGVFTPKKVYPVQGEEFASRTFCKRYDVYPDIDVSWEMPVGSALTWLFGNVVYVEVTFKYDYRANKAEILVKGGPNAVKELARAIPGFSETLAKAVAHTHGHGEAIKSAVAPSSVASVAAKAPSGQPIVDNTVGCGAGSVPNTQPVADQANH